MRLIFISLCLAIASLAFAKTSETNQKKHIPISMGINLNEPQTQELLETKGLNAVNFESEDPLLKNEFIDEYMDHENGHLFTINRDPINDQKEEASFSLAPYQELDNFKIRSLVNRFAQKRYQRFSEFGVTVNNDKTVILKKDSYVYTTGLESAMPGDVPNGIYPLFYKGDVEVAVDGFATIVDCPKKYEEANKCLDIQIPETPSADGIKITFTANSDTYLRDFHLILPTVNHEDVLAGKIVFNPDYLEYIKPFSTYRVMNMMISSPKAPFECVTTYVKNRDIYAIPKQALELEFLTHEELKNEDKEIFYTEAEIEAITPIVTKLLSQDDFLNIMTFDYRIQQNKKALEPLNEQLQVLRKKSLEYNWNYVNPDEDYGNCLMKYARTSENRAKLRDQFWGNSYITPEERWRGLPYEVIVALINQTKANVWLNIPHNASIDYVTDISKYFKDNLNSDSQIFLELSNEVWNGGFASQKYFTGLAKYRYEYYVTEFLDQFENYLKTSQDKVVTYRNIRKSYLSHFYHYKKEITEELEQFKSYTKDETPELFNNISLTETGISTNKVAHFLMHTNNEDSCENFVANDYLGENAFIQKIQYKKGNFFENLAQEIPYMNAYWLGYTGAAKGKLKTQVEDTEGNYKDVYVDRFQYIKAHKNELHSPDLVYHLSGNEIRDLQQKLFIEFKKGWNKRIFSKKPFDFNMNAKVYVLKNLDRAYQTMAQMAYVDRLDHVAKIWLDAGIDEKRLIFTLSTKQNNPNLTQSMLEYAVKHKSIERIDAIATPAYFFGCFGDLKVEDKIIKPHKFGPCKGISKGVLNAKTADEIIDVLKDPENPKGIGAIRKEMMAHKKVINKTDKRIQLVAYEGGHHLALANLGRNQRKYFDSHPELKVEKLALFKDAIEHIGMGEITKDPIPSMVRRRRQTI
ncbi:hypothetical protein GQR58_021958 [Nymphon striatum]|nr:hypothetical protein GQR58_021958 [Nymphon striatum]